MAGIVAFLVFHACRKIDYNRDKKLGIFVNNSERFFKVPANTDPLVKAIAEKIKRQNDAAKFVDGLSKKIGFPVWNKSMIASSSETFQRRTTSDSLMNYTYIPFALDSVVRATLIVRTTPEDTLMRLVNDWEYKLAGFDTTSADQWSAKDMFHVFARFEREIYGHTSFFLLDNRIASSTDSTSRILGTLRNTSGKNVHSRTNLLTPTTMCDYIDFCYAPIRKLKLKFVVATPTPDTSVNGQTTTGYYNSSTGELLDTIRINPTYLAKATELSMTRTIIHEITHAYLKLIFHTYLYNFSASQINSLSLDTLFNHYIDTLKALHTRNGVTAWSSGNPQFDHNFMANKMISHFAAVLEKIDQSRLTNKRYYWFLSWGGLVKTDVWKHYWPNYPTSPASGAVSHDSITQGFQYALTALRLDSMNSAIGHEQEGDPMALGLKKNPSGCYNPPD
jgi:hypothetical protein